ncbi:hypothetical protein BFP72_13490 [Reichenbachiella sp. 5M10]|uniref:lysophospholipid acyltransferase family protein n=1 Tax=Reichenbachiella sp. 5M10 TaxID=1889772 RepID=UPI000C4ADE69|nr:lysophospholipid acyltransferase family protein [Reichenbachiella sp. 5M10]PIB36335.1 hypothetical protein BFP72_13490 [Reichenbachiella sp. 5M10]
MQIIRYLWYYSFWIFVRLSLHFYYKKIKVIGYENVPKGVPVIFGANHQNALIDPLLMTTHVYQMTHYLVRADVFKNPLVKRFLNSLNLMPVYRARDGVNSIKANQEIFRACFDAFKAGESLMLFPEATHDERYVEKPMKKGIARIALGGVSEPDSPEALYLVPIGLTYSGQKKFRSSVVLHYGEAIKVEKQEESADNIDALKNRFEEELKKYHAALPVEGYEYLEKVYFHDQNPRKLILDYQVINAQSRILDVKASSQEKQEVLTLARELEQGGLNFPFEYRKSPGLVVLLLTVLSPFALIGFLANLPVIILPWKIMKGIKDKVFADTIYFGIGLVGLPFVWGGYTWLTYSLSGSWLISLVVLMGLPISLLLLGRFNKAWYVYRQNMVFRKSEKLKATYKQFVSLVERLKAYAN